MEPIHTHNSQTQKQEEPPPYDTPPCTGFALYRTEQLRKLGKVNTN